MHSTTRKPSKSRNRRNKMRADLNRSTSNRKTTAAKITAGQQAHWNRPTTLTGTLGSIAHDKRWSA